MKRDSALVESEDTFPALDETCFREAAHGALFAPDPVTHRPRILLLHGSLRERSFSRLANEEAACILGHVHLSGGNWGGQAVYRLRPRAV